MTVNSALKKLTKPVSHKGGGFLHMWQRDKMQEKNITLLYYPTEKKKKTSFLLETVKKYVIFELVLFF